MTDEKRKIECKEAIRRMLEFLDNELESGDHESMEAHLHACRSCFSRMEFEKRLKQMIKAVPDQKIPIHLKDRIKKITESF